VTTAPFVRCTSANLYAFLEEQLVPPITASLELAESGQRIRITTLPGPVMEGVCGALQGDDRWVARVLVAGVPDRSWKATATKLIELRNTLSKPLIVFIPPGLRTAAEDSLDIATFRELNLSASISHDLIDILLKRVPPALNQAVSDVVGHVRREKWAKNDDDLINYLLTIDVNGFSPESVGAALFTFGLVPHFTLSSQSNIPYWLSRNHKMQLVLADIRQPLQSRAAADKVAIDLTGCNTISLFGVQGFGKSYTLGVIAEMATASVQGINLLPSPLATVIFHYHKSDAYAPEFAAANSPNNKVREVEKLHREYDAAPQGVQDIVLLAPEAKVNERRLEFPGLEIHPIKFGSGELGAESWKFLLGAYGNDSLYVRQLIAIMRRHRDNLTLSRFREEINAADLTPQTRRLAEDRLNLAEPYVDDTATLGGLIRPGRTIIVDLRDPWIEKDEALGLFVVMMRISTAVPGIAPALLRTFRKLDEPKLKSLSH